MAFWAFGLAHEGGVDALLEKWNPDSDEVGRAQGEGSSSGKAASASPSSSKRDSAGSKSSPSIGIAEDDAPEDANGASTSDQASASLTLEQLLEEDDLLQECKNNNAKLLDFLSMPSTIKRLLDYISGEAFAGQPLPVPPPLATTNGAATSSPSKSLTSLAEQAQRVISPRISEEEKEANRKRLKYPFLCMEILAADPWQLTEAIFNDTDQYLLPFWNAILDKVPQELAEISVHAGHWSKVNIHWLSSSRAPQLVQFLKHVPNLFPRMLRHLPYVSPIFDVLVKLANTDESHPQLGIIDWLHKSRLIPQVLELLDPVTSPIEAHAPASEFLRSLIAATSAAVAAKQQQQQQEAAKMGEINSDSLGLSTSSTAWSNWPNNTLVRELASQGTMDTLLGYMLDVQSTDTAEGETSNSQEASSVTPTDSKFPPPAQASPPRRASAEAITSSLLNSLTVIIDIIRKNNSDFTELQIFHFLERVANASEGDERIGLEGEGEEGFGMQDYGPSLVDLEPLLRSLTSRLEGLNRLLTHPRSNISPRPTNLQGKQAQEPLCFERFRICELYAELIHCSNMAILNREQVANPSQLYPSLPEYDTQSGRILGPRHEAYAKLSHALNVSPAASPLINTGGDSLDQIHDEGLGEDVGPSRPLTNGRPVTAESNATSSYDSETDTISHGKDDSEDVFDQINVGTEDLSLDSENGSGIRISSAQSSPMPPSESTFSPLTTSSPPSSKNAGESQGSESPAQTPPSSADQAAKVKLPAGPALKKAFIDLEVVPTVLDLFFRFPWNNSLHNVVYDLIQQIFNGKLDEGMNRDLCVAVFTQREGLVDRILKAIEENDEILSKPHGVRLGHMGHLTLITEEIVKLFYTHGKDLAALVPESAIKSAQWHDYIDTTFRETRERDLQPLGGGISVGMHPSASTGSGGGHGIGLVEIDDEFPQTGSRTLFAAEEGSPGADPEKAHFARYLASQISADFQGPSAHTSLHRSTSSSSSSGSSSSDEVLEDASSPPARRQASRGTSGNAGGLDNAASAWFSPREGDSAFDDYDDDEEDSTTSAFGHKNRWHGDFDIGASSSVHSSAAAAALSQSHGRKAHDPTGPGAHGRQDKFGFDDRFDPAQFGSADSEDDEDDNIGISPGDMEDDEFGPFSDSFAAAPSPGAAMATVKGYSFDDDFATTSTVQHTIVREKLTPADWNSSFRSNFDGASPSFTAEFGDISTSSDSLMPSPNGDFQIEDDDDFGDFASSDANNHGDYDFSQADSSPQLDSVPEASPSTPSKVAATSSSTSTTPTHTPTRPSAVPISRHKRSASSIEREFKSKSVVSPVSPGQEIHGPGVHEGAHISMDGTHVEAEVEIDGKMVTVHVPKDELALHPDLVDD